MFTSVDSGWTRRLLSSLTLALVLVACGDDSGDSDDKDAESEEKADTGPKNDAATKDGSIDASDKEDASPSDASKATDAKVSDSGNDATTADAGGSIPTFNGCAAADYEDLSAPSADRKIAFGGGLEKKYDPKCMTIAVGQTVTFEGSFNGHPLAKGEPDDSAAGSANNPIPAADDPVNTGTSKTFTFSAAGTYPYHCVPHGEEDDMVGSIHVK